MGRGEKEMEGTYKQKDLRFINQMRCMALICTSIQGNKLQEKGDNGDHINTVDSILKFYC